MVSPHRDARCVTSRRTARRPFGLDRLRAIRGAARSPLVYSFNIYELEYMCYLPRWMTHDLDHAPACFGRAFAIGIGLNGGMVLIEVIDGWRTGFRPPIQRLLTPMRIEARTVMIVLGIAIVVSAGTAAMFASGCEGDLNIRGVYLHMASAALVSAGVVLSAASYLWKSGRGSVERVTGVHRRKHKVTFVTLPLGPNTPLGIDLDRER